MAAIATSSTSTTPASNARERFTAALVALLLGAFLFLGVGFAPLPAVHDAAHDTRHGFAFPCH
jgi:cobalt transporter subunit CbtB